MDGRTGTEGLTVTEGTDTLPSPFSGPLINSHPQTTYPAPEDGKLEDSLHKIQEDSLSHAADSAGCQEGGSAVQRKGTVTRDQS